MSLPREWSHEHANGEVWVHLRGEKCDWGLPVPVTVEPPKWFINISATVEGTEKADLLYWTFASLAREVRKQHDNVTVTSSLMDGEADEDIGPTIPKEFHDENTLPKVDAAIKEALTKVVGDIDRDALAIIHSLQNHGILFRERR